jgi:hypothetical protein
MPSIPNKNSFAQVTQEFDTLRFSEQGLPVDTGVIVQRPRGPVDKIIVRIESGVAVGWEAFATSEDFPGTPHERALFYARAHVGKPVSFKLHLVNIIGIRIRPLELLPAR